MLGVSSTCLEVQMHQLILFLCPSIYHYNFLTIDDVLIILIFSNLMNVSSKLQKVLGPFCSYMQNLILILDSCSSTSFFLVNLCRTSAISNENHSVQ